MRGSILLVLLAGGLAAGCDNGSNTVPSVSVRDTLGTVRLYAGTDTTVSLSGRFETTASTLTYSVTSDAPDVVRAGYLPAYGGQLRVQLLAPGNAMVRVTARAADGGEATMTVAVQTLDECPPGPEASQRDFFPIRDGQIWTYLYLYNSFSPGVSGYSVRGSGTIAYTFGNSTCMRGTRILSVGAHQTVRFTTTYSQGTTTIRDEENQSTFSLIETGQGVRLDRFGLGPNAKSIVRYHPASPMVVPSGGFILRSGHAPTSERYFGGTGPTSHFEETITLVSES